MILTCRLATNNIQTVEVQKTDPLYKLKEKLDIKDNITKFIFKEMTYMVDSNLTFESIGLTSDALLVFNSQAISGI